MLCAPSTGYTEVYPGDDRWAKGDPVDQSRFDWSTGGGALLPLGHLTNYRLVRLTK